jgi:hypothetical protein
MDALSRHGNPVTGGEGFKIVFFLLGGASAAENRSDRPGPWKGLE